MWSLWSDYRESCDVFLMTDYPIDGTTFVKGCSYFKFKRKLINAYQTEINLVVLIQFSW
jgi:hypothetical protein